MAFLVDCSHYQGAINWPQVKAAGCVGAYVKVTDGVAGVDATWQTNHAGATAVGLPVGPYHFAEGASASGEAAHFASIWGAGWQLYPVLDYEIAGVNAAWLSAFRAAFRQDTGFQPFRVYASEANLAGALNPSGWIDSDTTIWAARYNNTLGWNHPQLVLWQNTSTAAVAGILGSVDEDQFQNGWTPEIDITHGGIVTSPLDIWTVSLPNPHPTDAGQSPTAEPKDLLFEAHEYVQYNTQTLADPNTGLAALAKAVAAVSAQVSSLAGEVTSEQTALLAAIQGVQAGTVDVSALAQALVPILAPADAAAFQAALATALSK